MKNLNYKLAQVFFYHASVTWRLKGNRIIIKSRSAAETCFVWFCLRSWIWSLSLSPSGAGDWQWERFCSESRNGRKDKPVETACVWTEELRTGEGIFVLETLRCGALKHKIRIRFLLIRLCTFMNIEAQAYCILSYYRF